MTPCSNVWDAEVKFLPLMEYLLLNMPLGYLISDFLKEQNGFTRK